VINYDEQILNKSSFDNKEEEEEDEERGEDGP